MPSADAESLCKLIRIAIVQCVLTDEPKGSRDGCGSPGPGGSSWGRIRPAAEARSVACAGRRRSAREILDVFFFGGSRGTNRAAVNARRTYGNEEAAIKSGIAGFAGTPANFGVEGRHVPRLRQIFDCCWPFSDTFGDVSACTLDALPRCRASVIIDFFDASHHSVHRQLREGS
jgi:hypothetical protein